VTCCSLHQVPALANPISVEHTEYQRQFNTLHLAPILDFSAMEDSTRNPQSTEYWDYLQPTKNFISCTADTPESAALRSKMVFHLSGDGMDCDGQPQHPAFIQDVAEREAWSALAIRQIDDMVCYRFMDLHSYLG
jgi:hypothetical protein